MNTVERIKSICKERHIPISKLEKDLGFGNAYISGLRKGTVPDDRLRCIADYLGLSVDYLMTGKESQFILELAKTDVALTSMPNHLKEYALKMASLTKENQELIIKMIDKLGDL